MAHAKIPRLSDRELGEKLSTIYHDINGRSEFELSVQIFGQPISGGHISHGGSDAWRHLTATDGSLIEQVSVQVAHGMIFYYYRGGASETKSPYFDEINIRLQPTEPIHLEYAARIVELFRPNPISPTGTEGDEHVAALRAIQEGTLDRLERLHEDGVRRASESLTALEEEYRKKRAALEDEVASQKLLLELENTDEKNRLTQVELSLKARAEQLDDRDNTHARRDNRTRMLNDVKERFQNFGVTEATARKRGPVKSGIFILGIILIAFAAISWAEVISRELFRNDVKTAAVVAAAAAASASRSTAANPEALLQIGDGAQYVLWLRTGLLTLGVAATVLYYIRWQNAWAEQHSKSEFALQQFHIDVNRANWVMESCLEWHKTTGTPIPDSLIGAFTRGLFSSGDSSPPQALHPADELASALLGTASKLKLKAGDSEIEFDKPGRIPKQSKVQKDPSAT